MCHLCLFVIIEFKEEKSNGDTDQLMIKKGNLVECFLAGETRDYTSVTVILQERIKCRR